MLDIVRDIVFELTLKCNLNCHICSRKFLQNKTDELNIELFKNVIIDLREHCRERVNFNFGGYGEPFMYQHLFDAIHIVKSAYPKSTLTITTNGHLLNESVREKIVQSQLDYLRISLNATNKDEYHNLMNNSKFETVESNIEGLFILKKRYKKQLKIGLQILDSKTNSAQFITYKQKWEKYFSDEDFITLRKIENRAGVIDANKLSDDQSLNHIESRWPCYALWRNIAIDATGRVFACCEAYTFRDETTELYLGSIHQQSIVSIMNSSQLLKVQHLHLNDDYTSLPECLRCTKIVNYPNLWRRDRNNQWTEKK